MQGEDAILKVHSGESPGGLAVRIWCFHCHGLSSNPDLESKVPQAAQCGKKKKNSENKKKTTKSSSWKLKM